MNLEIKLDTIRIGYNGAAKNLPVKLSVRLSPGSGLLLSGPSGAGKSLTLRHLAGITPQIDKQSHISYEGFEFRSDVGCSHSDALSSIAYVPQDLNQFFVAPTAYQEIEVGYECCGAEPKSAKAQRRRLFYRMGLCSLTFSKIGTLSAGEKSMLAIGSALARRPSVLLLDEPFFTLASEATLCIVTQLKEFMESGGVVVMTSHDSTTITDYITELSFEQHALSAPPATGKAIPENQKIVLIPRPQGPLYRIEGVDLQTPEPSTKFLFSFDDVVVERGDMILIEGKNGTGKTTFLRHAAGLLKGWPEGAVFDGKDVNEESPQYPDDVGFVSDSPMTTAFEGVVHRYMSFFLDKSQRDGTQARQTGDFFLDLLEAFGVSRDAFIADLSYGQQKLVSLARCANCPTLLFVDEMPISIDPKQQQILKAFLEVFRERGTSIIFTTHSAYLFRGVYNRRLTIRGGWLHEELI